MKRSFRAAPRTFPPGAFPFLLLLLLPCALPAPVRAGAEGFRLEISPAEAREIGRKVWRNECGGRVEGLLAWNAGEAFPSFGIGHFIWYPAGRRGVFKESFPALLDFFISNGIDLPPWLAASRAKGCPWPDRKSFLADRDARSGPGVARLRDLRDLLAGTVDLQAAFLAKRLAAALPAMLDAPDDPADRKSAETRFRRLAASPGGLYALVDYVNFKGEGTEPGERYKGEGWGLLQVLLGMSDGPDPLEDFAAAADRALARRVANAPRDETRWLAGWRNRVRTYVPKAGAK